MKIAAAKVFPLPCANGLSVRPQKYHPPKAYSKLTEEFSALSSKIQQSQMGALFRKTRMTMERDSEIPFSKPTLNQRNPENVSKPDLQPEAALHVVKASIIAPGLPAAPTTAPDKPQDSPSLTDHSTGLDFPDGPTAYWVKEKERRKYLWRYLPSYNAA